MTSPKKKSAKRKSQPKFSLQELKPSQWNKPRLKKLLESFAGKRVLVVGDVGVDRYTLGTVERISPEAPVPIVLVEEERLKLGLAANVADNIKTLDAEPILIGIVGLDRAADDFRALLRNSGIEPSYLVEDPTRRTVLKERIVSERQQLLRVDYENLHGISSAIELKLMSQIREVLKRVDAVILEDYAKGMVHTKMTHAFFQMAKKAGKLVAVDPNTKTAPEVYRGATVLTPNVKEAEKLSGMMIRDEATLVEAGALILKSTQADQLVITRGKDGMAIFEKNSKKVRLIPTYAREVYDVSGAGDTVISVLTLTLACGGSIEDACILANLAGGVEVGKRGTATVNGAEIREAMDFVAGR